MTEKQEQDGKEYSTDRVDFKVYDVPIELKNKYISLAKLEYDNEMWKVLEAGMNALLEERERKVPELETKVGQLQKQIVFLKTKIEDLEKEDLDQKEENGPPKTFGASNDTNKPEEDGDELLNRFSSQ